jgi:hypothetical protein
LEKTRSVDQKPEPKFPAIRDFIFHHEEVFRRQGSVVASWRPYQGARLGPFYSLRCRIGGRQVAIYLGRSEALATQVRKLLQDLQQARQFRRLLRQARKELRRNKSRWARDLASIGLGVKGFEVHGWRNMQEGDIR